MAQMNVCLSIKATVSRWEMNFVSSLFVIIVITDSEVKVIFSQVCVSHSVHGGVSLHAPGQGVCVSKHAPGQGMWTGGGCGHGVWTGR